MENGTDKDIIVLTGFGPFDIHKVNASWEAVRNIRDTNLWDDPRADLIIENIPVSYDFVMREVPDKWTKSLRKSPKAVVHVGVSNVSNVLTLEKIANNCGYEHRDVHNKTPENQKCMEHGADCLTTNFDVDKIVDVVNSCSKALGVKCQASEDAGRYLCCFSFYKSLDALNGDALFIHVPPLGKPYSQEQLARAICLVLKCILDQMDETNCAAQNTV